ncbi:MAG: ParB/RepB/Spo0J family partition protein [Nitrospinota bacterium]
MQRKALGKGIGALIPVGDESGEQAGVEIGTKRVLDIPIELVSPNPDQPRQDFNEKQVSELAESIKENGVIQPIIVQRRGEKYEIIAGERRWRAAHLAGFETIPAILKEVTEKKSLELALIENIQRENLNPVEEAMAYQALIDKFGLTQEKIADVVNKDRSSIANIIRLLKLPEEILNDIRTGRLSMGHARAILSLGTTKNQIMLKNKIIRGGLSVRRAESMVNSIKDKNKPQAVNTANIYISQFEDKLKRCLGAKTRISKKGGKGKIEIQFSSEEELERILGIITGE